ncbi:thioesterase family protein [Actinopolyspora mortivallis]|uniref:Thioesterase family protein n=1 Tax=Actinopolyspora mortivallis TaxID=33906 RepID=A0A2T0GUF0_ACTMO|nr:thioesterase family protein [Actinopolyspora mortivallis]PRW62653.1 thioesterase family protein [Actinopolyspora mortivallis]
MSDNTQTLFQFTRDGFLPTEAAGNPWGELTGGGPVAGLLTRAVERSLPDGELSLARMTFDLMRPVPRREVAVDTRTLRSGKRLHVVEAELTCEGRPLTRATFQALRPTELDGRDQRTEPPFPGPDGIPDGSLIPPELGLRWGVHDVVDVRWVDDQSSPDASRLWMRMPVPLLPDEELSPLVHTATLVDCVSAASPVGELFGPWINTDITCYLHRRPAGDWLGMEIRRSVETNGIGLARARLFDRQGAVGTAQEAVLVNDLG